MIAENFYGCGKLAQTRKTFLFNSSENKMQIRIKDFSKHLRWRPIHQQLQNFNHKALLQINLCQMFDSCMKPIGQILRLNDLFQPKLLFYSKVLEKYLKTAAHISVFIFLFDQQMTHIFCFEKFFARTNLPFLPKNSF